MAMRIDLQTGFTGQRVEISINGTCVFSSDNVHTQLLLGFAQSVTPKDTNMDDNANKIEITVEGLPKYVIRTEFGKAPPYLGVGIENGKVVHSFSQDAFGYG